MGFISNITLADVDIAKDAGQSTYYFHHLFHFKAKVKVIRKPIKSGNAFRKRLLHKAPSALRL